MSRRSVEGICRPCGAVGKLSFEHVPPESAFNSRPIYVASFKDFFGHDLDSIRGRQQQRGAGAHTLCESCNSRTGSWYGSSYAEWAEQGMNVLRWTRGRASLSYGYRIFPLRVLKQIVCMFVSANSQGFRDLHPELEAFALFETEMDGAVTKDKRARRLNVAVLVATLFGDRKGERVALRWGVAVPRIKKR
jgi:hypothetical protein